MVASPHLCQQLCSRWLWLSLFDDISVSIPVGIYDKIFQGKGQEKIPCVQNITLSTMPEGFPGQMVHSWAIYLPVVTALFVPQSESLSWVVSVVSPPRPAYVSHLTHLCFLSSTPSCDLTEITQHSHSVSGLQWAPVTSPCAPPPLPTTGWPLTRPVLKTSISFKALIRILY